MFDYQINNKYFAQVSSKMETLCEEELIELGAVNTKVDYRGVHFEADNAALYGINYASRLISRVLAPLISFPCHTTNMLIKTAKKIKWDLLFPVEKTFSISASVSKSKITNSLFASQCLKDGIADYFRETYLKRPDVNTVSPDVRFNLHIEKDQAIVSLDISGESLHKRGYRLLAGEAPMPETLAAALVRLSNWNGENVLMDCMCGSGTILCEALMHYCRIPAQYLRSNFGFFYMPEFQPDIWKNIKEEYDKKIRPMPKGLIIGSDKSQKSIEVAANNLSRLPFGDSVELSCKQFQNIKQFENGTMIVNPPYGIRLGELEEVRVLYKNIGDFLKLKCKGTRAFIYTGNQSLRKSIGLKTSRRIHLDNGKLEGVLIQIDSYEGSKKKYYLEYKEQEQLTKS
jgi:putative N6-adenine-specific DNA methylase